MPLKRAQDTEEPVSRALADDVDDVDDVDTDTDPTDDDGTGRSTNSTSSNTGDVTAEVKRRRREARELKTANAELKARLDELEAKDKTDLENATTRLAKFEEQLAQMTEALNEARIKNTFLTANTYTWHNPDRAWRMLDLAEVEINDDGTVEGLEDAIKALAESDPYLIKKANAAQDDDDTDDTDDGKGAVATGNSTDGRRPATRRRNDSVAASEAALRAKYRI